jgi:hypothetical protein
MRKKCSKNEKKNFEKKKLVAQKKTTGNCPEAIH